MRGAILRTSTSYDPLYNYQMKSDSITIKIGDRTYEVDTANPESLNNMQESDRLLLVELLETLKPDSTSPESVYVSHNPAPEVNRETQNQNISAKNMGKGDIDTLVATLMAEERSKRKPGIDQRSFLKIIGGVASAIVLLIIII